MNGDRVSTREAGRRGTFRARCLNRAVPVLLALVAVTAVWGVTFVQVKDAVELYPLFPFLALRFGIATLTLAAPGLRRARGIGRGGAVPAAAAGVLLAGGYVLQTLGLERTSVSNAGFVTGMYVVLTPLLGLALFRFPVGRRVWLGVVLATTGLALIAGVPRRSPGRATLGRAGPGGYADHIR